MPLIEPSTYEAPSRLFKNPHFSTIYIGRFKKTKAPNYQRERIELGDGDFLDLDFQLKGKEKAIILCHGLEGGSVRSYNNTSANYFLSQNYSVFAWNNRSCSGEMNRLPLLYHHAVVDDLEVIVNRVLEQGFESVYLMGFSMGGAQLINYLSRKSIDPRIKSAVAISTPIHLKDSAEKLKKGFNKVYMKNFTRKISKKLKVKQQQFPDLIDWSKLKKLKSFDEVDEHFTAPLHGFLNKEDYYTKASPNYSMENLKTPVLVINSLDDPFLGVHCFPRDFAVRHPFFHLEISQHGGHCAFPSKNSPFSYSELRAHSFFQKGQ